MVPGWLRRLCRCWLMVEPAHGDGEAKAQLGDELLNAASVRKVAWIPSRFRAAIWAWALVVSPKRSTRAR